jgi:chromosome segregation ATPase
MERYKSQLKPLIQRISIIDALIDTKESELLKFNDVDFDSLLLRIDEKTNELTKVDECIADASKLLEPLICERERIIKEIHSKSVELGDARFKFEGAKSEELMALMSEIQDVDRQNQDIKKSNKRIEEEYEIALSSLSAKKKLLETLNKQRDLLVERRNEVKSSIFNGERCEFCGHLLSEYDIDKAKKEFNEHKELSLKSIIEEGKIVKAKIDEVCKDISDLSEIISIGCKLEEYKDKDKLVKEYESLKSSQKSFEETDTYRKIEEEINELKARMPEIKNDTSELSSTKERLMSELQSLNREYGKKAVKDGFEREIELLKTEKRNLGSEIVRLEGCIDTIKEYEEERARIISDKINNKLDDCRIVMYSRQKDGELRPDCVILDKNGVPYATTNNANRLNAALSLQRMFCANANILLPVFVDEASIYDDEHLPKYNDTQCIYLYASNDNEMRIE